MYAVLALAVLLLGSAVVGSGIRLAWAQHQAAAAADLSALAAAQAVGTASEPCVEAARVAAANDARLESCQVSGDVVEVLVEVATPRLWGRSWQVRQAARAGPVSAA